jgi:putative ABC transport system substrate-binding protein
VNRRSLISLLGGAAVTWPLAAHAQQDRPRLVGVVAGFSEPEMRPQITALRSRLRELGWTENQNLKIEARLSSGDFQRLTVEAGSLVGRNPDVIVTMGTPGPNAVRHHTKSIPVVFTLVADPARLGLIDSLARPGGHATGFTNFELSIGQKWLELIRDVSPRLARVTIINNPANPASQMSRPVEDAGRTLSIQVSTAFVRSANEIESAIQTAAQQPDTGIIVIPDSFAVVHSDLILRLAEHHRLPAIYPFRLFALKGGLLTYGLDIPEIYRQAGEYADRILRGAKPTDLPVQAPNKFELIVNLKTAKALGLEIPPTLLARADEVIE